MTLRAKPWLVTHREMRTPIAASLSSADPHAGQPGHATGRRRRRRADGLDQHLLEIADVSVNVAAVRLEIDDRDSRRADRDRDT